MSDETVRALPELPEPGADPYFTIDQMRDYAAAAIEQQAAKVEALERSLAEAEKDARRLDCAERLGLSVGCNWKNTGFCGPSGQEWCVFVYGTGGRRHHGKTVREAIDAAMQEPPPC